MKPGVSLSIFLVLVIAIGGFVLVNESDDDQPENVVQQVETATAETNDQTLDQSEIDSQSTDADETEDDSTVGELFTEDQVAAHNSADDCWTIVSGTVYDITDYIPRHPGGDRILQACGQDGTSLFNERQTAEGEPVGTGTPHSSSANSQLQDFEIGTLDLL